MDWIELLSGIAIFIYGLQLANDDLQKRAGDQLRRWLTAFTERRLSGLLSGTLFGDRAAKQHRYRHDGDGVYQRRPAIAVAGDESSATLCKVVPSPSDCCCRCRSLAS
jgi:Na+/Pi-cotransporter